MSDLWPHQERALEALASRDAVMIHYGMGTGKSRIVVEHIRRHAPARTLILCPLSVCQVWPYQLRKHGVSARPLVLDSGLIRDKAKRIEPYLKAQEARDEPAIVVVNYDSAWRTQLGKKLAATFWDLSVCDESHRIKSPTSKIARFSHLRLRPVSKKRVCMTGTLLPHSPLDIVGQYAFLDPKIFGPWQTGFLRRYAIMGGYENRQVVRWENADELREKIALLELRARSEDVLSLPPSQHVELPVSLPSKALSIYRLLEDEFLAEVDAGTITAANAMVKLLRLQQVTGGATKTEDGRTAEIHREKESALSDLLESADPSEPVVVFARFHSDLDQTIRAAKDRGGVLELSGRKN
ncbi:MAG TPA: SNF2-related protein, partial [Planctomycetota bacterium]|nr:SNF2-related protein [Planctomycetota bacterium]